MILSDRDILARFGEQNPKRRLRVEPLQDPLQAVQAASVDVRLGSHFLVYQADPTVFGEAIAAKVWVQPGDEFWIVPGTFVLATTVERISMPFDLVARIEGKSSVGRLGVIVHATAGFIDPGFGYEEPSEITLEMSCVFPVPVRLTAGMYVAQIAFEQMTSAALRPYGKARGSHYHAQRGPVPSWLNGGGS